MTITGIYYVYGVVVEKKVFNELKDEKKLFDVFDIPHDSDPINFGLDETDKKEIIKTDCNDYIIVGKVIDTITFGFEKISIEFDIEKEKELQTKLELIKLPTDCEYITVPNDCNCCS